MNKSAIGAVGVGGRSGSAVELQHYLMVMQDIAHCCVGGERIFGVYYSINTDIYRFS